MGNTPLFLVIAVLAACVVAGCGGSSPAPAVLAEVRGTVVADDPADTRVGIYPAGHAGNTSQLIAETGTGAQGDFRFSNIPEGTYDLRVTCIGHIPSADGSTEPMIITETKTNVGVTAPVTDLGIVTVAVTPP